LKVPDSWRWWVDPLLHEEPGATCLAVLALVLMVVGAVLTIRSGRWYGRAVLILGGSLWPLPDLDWQGPVVLPLGGGHGVHLVDLLSVVAVGIALFPWRRAATASDR
jgi:hypothetical protein